jgi:hypothetical protein
MAFSITWQRPGRPGAGLAAIVQMQKTTERIGELHDKSRLPIFGFAADEANCGCCRRAYRCPLCNFYLAHDEAKCFRICLTFP